MIVVYVRAVWGINGIGIGRELSRPDIDRPPAALYAKPRKGEDHVTSQIGNMCTAVLVPRCYGTSVVEQHCSRALQSLTTI